MTGKNIILTADDFGAMDFIDDAIIECVRNGTINCVSAFVCFPTSMQRILKLKEIREKEGLQFGIGLHFCVTAGNPTLQKQNSLSERVKGVLQFKDAKHYPFTKIVHTELLDELEEQLRLMANWLGDMDKIDHISNHHGVVYVDDQFFTMYSEAAVKHQVPIRSPKLWSRARLDYDREPFKLFNPLTRYGIYQLQWAMEFFEARHDARRVLEAEFKQLTFPYCNNDCIYGLGHIKNIQAMINNYQYCQQMTTEFMFHLGYFKNYRNEQLNEITPNGIDPGYFDDRKKELELLRSEPFKMAIQNAGLSTVTFRQLVRGAHVRV